MKKKWKDKEELVWKEYPYYFLLPKNWELEVIEQQPTERTTFALERALWP